MTKRNISLAVFSIFIFISIIYFLPVANGYDYIFTDAEDDVYLYNHDTSELVNGDYHDEIDIVKLNITGKYVNITIAGDLGDWNYSHFADLTFSERFFPWGEPLDYAFTPPYYSIEFENDSSFFVTLEKGYSLGGGKFAYEEWNGTAWENRTTATPANILSEVSQHSIIAYIPDAVEEIPSNMKCLLYTQFWQYPFVYADFAPALPTAGGGDAIPSYDLFLLICVMIGISLLLVRKRNKLK